MRSDSIEYSALSSAVQLEPVHVIELSFTLQNDDQVYFTDSGNVPFPAGTTQIFQNVVRSISDTSQRLDIEKFNATIGNLSFGLVDVGGTITDILRSKSEAGKSISQMRVRIHRGFAGMDFSKFSVVQTQIVQNMHLDAISYRFNCLDVQRTQKKTLFKVKSTVLTSNVAADDDFINVITTDGLETVFHGSSYSDAPGLKVGYVEIVDDNKSEVVRWESKTSTGLMNIQRGALGTRARDFLAIDNNENRNIEVRELVYLELPAVKLEYALLTGNLFNDAGEKLPDHWNLGVDAQYISTAHFTTIGADIWDPLDDSKGKMLRFVGVEDEDGKKFIEAEVNGPHGLFNIVLATGELGLKRVSGVLSTSPYGAVLDKSNIKSVGHIRYKHDAIINLIQVDWGWTHRDDVYKRTNAFIDSESASLYKNTKIKTFQFKGLQGQKHSAHSIRDMFDAYRDRFSGPPITVQLKLMPQLNVLEVGDTVRVNLEGFADHLADGYLDRTFEVQYIKNDWISGEVVVDLFASSRKAGALADYGGGDTGVYEPVFALPDDWYTINGTDIEAAYPANFSRDGDVVTLTQDLEVTGEGQLYDSPFTGYRDGAVFYVNGDFVIPSGRQLTLARNGIFKTKGFFTCWGTFNLRGKGTPGGTFTPHGDFHVRGPWGGNWFDRVDLSSFRFTGDADSDALPGFISKNIRPQESLIVFASTRYVQFRAVAAALNPSSISYTGYTLPPPLSLKSDVLYSDIDFLSGLPIRLEGAGGPVGGGLYSGTIIANGGTELDFTLNTGAEGGDGGVAGGGVAIFCRGMDFGASGQLDVSGGDSPQNLTPVTEFHRRHEHGHLVAPWESDWIGPVYAGVGGGGGPGAAYIFVDGTVNSPPLINGETIRAEYGISKQLGDAKAGDGGYRQAIPLYGGAVSCYAVGNDQAYENNWEAHVRLQVLTPHIDAQPDIEVETDQPLSIVLSEKTNTPITPAGDQSSIEVTVMPPTTGNYSYSHIQYRLLGVLAWSDVGPAEPETAFQVPSDGSSYQVRALAVSTTDNMLTSGPVETIAVIDFSANQSTIRPASNVTGLRISGKSIGVLNFDTPDLSIRWNLDNVGGVPNTLDDWFDHFLIEFRDGATVAHTVETKSNYYTLTKAENDTISGGPFSSLNARVYQVTVDGEESAIAAQQTFSNIAPGLPSSFGAMGGAYGASIAWANPTNNDLASIEIYMNTVAGFTPAAGNKVFDALADSVSLADLQPATQYYFVARARDCFGSVSAFSAAESFTTGAAGSGVASWDGLTGKPDDSDLLNSEQQWGDIDGPGTPADNADVTTEQLGGNGVNSMAPLYSVFNAAELPPLTLFFATAALDATDSVFGAGCVKVVNTNASFDSRVYFGATDTTYNIPRQPSTKYRVSVYVKVQVAGTRIKFYVKNSGAAYSVSSDITIATSSVWERISYDFTTNNLATTSELRLDSNSLVGDYVKYDGIMIEEVIGSASAPSAFALPGNDGQVLWGGVLGINAPSDNADNTVQAGADSYFGGTSFFRINKSIFEKYPSDAIKTASWSADDGRLRLQDQTGYAYCNVKFHPGSLAFVEIDPLKKKRIKTKINVEDWSSSCTYFFGCGKYRLDSGGPASAGFGIFIQDSGDIYYGVITSTNVAPQLFTCNANISDYSSVYGKIFTLEIVYSIGNAEIYLDGVLKCTVANKIGYNHHDYMFESYLSYTGSASSYLAVVEQHEVIYLQE